VPAPVALVETYRFRGAVRSYMLRVAYFKGLSIKPGADEQEKLVLCSLLPYTE